MIKIIKNIVITALILNIFTSAVGLNIHMHHCNTSGNTIVSFFETDCEHTGECSVDFNNHSNCESCGIEKQVSKCCVDYFERKSLDIETISKAAIELKPNIKIEFVKLIPNYDDITSDNLLKNYKRLPRDVIFNYSKLIFCKMLKISSNSDDDLIS